MPRVVALCVMAGVLSVRAGTAAADVGAEIERARAAAHGSLHVRRIRPGGPVSFLAAPAGLGLAGARAAGAGGSVRAFLGAHGALFGLSGADGAAVLHTTERDDTGMAHVHLRQEADGVPVSGSGLSVHLRGGAVVSAFARTVADADSVDRQPTLSASQATAVAGALIADLEPGEASLSAPQLELFNRGLFMPDDAPTRLAWFVEAVAGARREWIWIDAHSGAVLLHFNQNPDALFRRVYDAMDTSAVPGTLARSEGDPPTGNAAVDAMYDFVGDTYDYYLTEHARDSYDGAGATMDVTINSTVCGSPCLNAFWYGNQAVFGWLDTDDVVGHEFTHGVTQYEANLIYFMESGAMNESYSDIFGETIDLVNGAGPDAPANRWWVAEEFVPGNLGIRNMADPTLRHDPGKMSDPQFVCNDGSVDGGGVHSNSGIGNHAYALMVDGGTYNGFTIAGIGLTKAGKIEYRALSEYLVPTSTYADKYDALNQSCLDLIGTAGISAADCVEVQKALDAVEMSSPWPCVSGTPTPSPTPSLTPTRTATPTTTPTPLCGATPRLTCADAPKARVLIKRDSEKPDRNKLQWKWLRGTTAEDSFGDPTAGSTYRLCVYQGAGPAPWLVAEVPAGGDWQALGSGRFAYDGDLSADGMQRVKLKPGDGNAKILVKGRGPNLGLPSATVTYPLTLQLVRSDGPECWRSVFVSPPYRATETLFKDAVP